MSTFDFSQYSYIPSLQSSTAEHMGFQELDTATKKSLLPIFELSQRNNAPNLAGSFAAIKDSVGELPFILDLSKEAAPPPYIASHPKDPAADKLRVERELEAQASYNAQLNGLLNPTNGFAQWRAAVAGFQNAIPTLQYTDAASQNRQLLRQAAFFSKAGSPVVVRVTPESAPAMKEIVPQLISIFESPDQLLIVMDCGQGRTQITNRAAFAAETMQDILSRLDVAERPLARAVCLSNSFTNPQRESLQDDYENLDWKLWREVNESFPFMVGDYAATYRRKRKDTFVPPDFRATVVCPLEEVWLVYRDQNANDAEGWIKGSEEIAKHEKFAGVPKCWGKKLISDAAAGDMVGHESARFWYAAKVNIHLTQQCGYAPLAMAEDADGE